jgi:hypothetical protein
MASQWLVHVVNQSPWNLNITGFKKSDFEKIVPGM